MQLARFLTGIREGVAAIEFEEQLQRVASEVSDTGKAGTVTFKITIEPAGGNRLTIRDEIVGTPPKRAKESTQFFFDEERGDLTRTDPRQANMGELLEINKTR